MALPYFPEAEEFGPLILWDGDARHDLTSGELLRVGEPVECGRTFKAVSGIWFQVRGAEHETAACLRCQAEGGRA